MTRRLALARVRHPDERLGSDPTLSPGLRAGPRSGPNGWAGLNAVVTGGGSGIGGALVRALVARGVNVAVADLDKAAAVRVAGAATGPGSARGVPLDVTDATAVQALVDDVVSRDGRLDLMFNNAGITFGGETDQLTLTQWNAIIDVNIRGVVHGIAAAYPVMIRQGHGQIVNTASMGGLLAAGLLTSYVMTKHAVVGLSLALRSEAAGKGIGVTVLCPAAVETPILDKGEIGDFRGRDYYLRGQGVRRAMDPDVLAELALDAVATDRAMLVAPRQARMLWRLGRLSPTLVQRSSIRFIERQRQRMSKSATPEPSTPEPST